MQIQEVVFLDLDDSYLALASGIRIHMGSGEPYPGYFAGQYGIGGAIGGAIGSAVADAIFGSAERRKIRRINLRNCMAFKEYQRYGMERERWQKFNFEEGMGRQKEDQREQALLRRWRNHAPAASSENRRSHS